MHANVAGTVISLEHDLTGTIGNQPISADGAIGVSGLDGGLGSDCAAGASCAQDADCDPRLICGTDGTCQGP